MTDEDEQPPPEAAPEQESLPEAPETALLFIAEDPPVPAPPEPVEYLPVQYIGPGTYDTEGRRWYSEYIQFLPAEEATPLLAQPDLFRRHPTVRPRIGSPTAQPAPRPRG